MLSTAYAGYNLVRSVCDLPGICSRPCATGSAAPEHMALALELVAALRDSAFMEHAARSQLLLAQLVPPLVPGGGGGGGGGGDGGGGGSDDGLAAAQRHLRLTTASCQGSIVKLKLLRDRMVQGLPQPVPHGEDAAAGASSTLKQILYGRCVHTARLYFGVAALCAADGGPAYGLPPPLLDAVMTLADVDDGDHEGGDGDGAGAGGGGVAAGDGVVSSSGNTYPGTLMSILMLILSWAQPAPPGNRAVCALALRIGRLALASLPPATVEAGAGARTEAGGGGGAGGFGSGGSAHSNGGGGSGDSGGAGMSGSERGAVRGMLSYTAAAAATAPSGVDGGGGGSGTVAVVSAPTGGLTRPRRLLPYANAAGLCCTALSAARRQLLRRDGAHDSATWRADAAECWRLATAAVWHALPDAGEGMLMDIRNGFLWLWLVTARAAPIPGHNNCFVMGN
ncbi:hypothetical protein GPECTOR_77g39 [Gonium pectorale]|uniref:Uncharacterized protein n=1 Tax=Gonium pectorale TaxID=33097 RepID=A0A150G286_GONPE|nr:hypothetical protein GPECTOR_77g39 [Gonium pectorale]|eukprot:KXZ43943.1 hypothetical protein GPECTOR_77g39 [Gonium pectorale]